MGRPVSRFVKLFVKSQPNKEGEMALREVSNSKVFPKYKPENENKVIAEGHYLGRVPSTGEYGGFNHEIAAGEGLVALTEVAQLRNIFGGRVQPGDYVVVTYLGKKAIKGGKTAHGFKVQVDDEKRRTVQAESF